MASDIVIGRKPASTQDVAIGELALGQVRCTWFVTPTADYWLTHLGGHVGWDGGGTAPTARFVVYDTHTSGAPRTKQAETPPVVTRSIYNPAGGAGGENLQVQLPAPVILRRNVVYQGGAHAGGRWMTMGQNADGTMMYRDNGHSWPPVTYTADLATPEGRLSFWGVARQNTKPNVPSAPSPAVNASTNDARPWIATDFRDPDEVLTGFGVGTADRLDAYQVIIYNNAKSAVIWDSGIVLASVEEQNTRRANTRPPSNLTAGTYVVWTRHRDRVGAWSSPLEWRFTVASGGSLVPVAPGGRITQTAPSISFLYEHIDGFDINGMDLLLSDGTTDLDAAWIDVIPAQPVGSVITFDWPPGFDPLPRGQTRYLRARPYSSNGFSGAYSAMTMAFRVNSLPLSPSLVSPAAGAILTSISPFRVTVAADADDDDPSGFTVTGRIALAATPTLTSDFPMQFVGWSGALAVFEGTPGALQMPTYDSYVWTAVATDQFGESSTESAALTFNYAEPPTITITDPPGSVFTVGSPTVAFTSSPSASKQRVRLVDAITRQTLADTGLVTATGSATISSGIIRDGRSYDLIVGVLTGLGAYAEMVHAVTASFTPPPTITGQSVTLVSGAYDIAGEPTIALLAWTQTSVAEAKFRGYGIYRSEGAGDFELIAVEPNINTVTFSDDSARIGVTCRYYVTVFADESLDLLESEPPAVIPEATMQFGGTIITDMGAPGMNRIVARYWLDRNETPVRSREQHDGWGEYPTLFSGERSYTRMSGTWDIHEEIEFGASELKDAMIALADPARVEITVPTFGGTTRQVPVLRPRSLCYRDGLGRRIYGSLEIEQAKDTKREPHDVSWTFIQTSAGPAASVLRPSSRAEIAEAPLMQALQGLTGG